MFQRPAGSRLDWLGVAGVDSRGWPMDLRSFDRTRNDRSSRLAFAAIESFDCGVDEFCESLHNRRRSSVVSTCKRLDQLRVRLEVGGLHRDQSILIRQLLTLPVQQFRSFRDQLVLACHHLTQTSVHRTKISHGRDFSPTYRRHACTTRTATDPHPRTDISASIRPQQPD